MTSGLRGRSTLFGIRVARSAVFSSNLVRTAFALPRGILVSMLSSLASHKWVPRVRCHDEHETVGSLLDKLRALCGDDRAKLKELPKTARALGGLLRRYAPELRTAGLDVVFGRRTRSGWPVTIKERVRAQPAQPSHRHEPRESGASRRDGHGDGRDEWPANVTATVTEKPNEINACDGRDGSADTQSREESQELPRDALDRRAGEVEASPPNCAYCHEPIEASIGFTATSSGEYLHNGCIDAGSRR
jgi:hypothetical protein